MSLTKHLTQKINLIINNINSVFEEVIRRSLGSNGNNNKLNIFKTN